MPNVPFPTVFPDTVACGMDPYRQPDWVPKRAKKNIPFVFSYMTPSGFREHPRLRLLPARPSLDSDPRVSRRAQSARSVFEAPMHCPTSAAEALTFSFMKAAHVVARLRERSCRPLIEPQRSCGAVPGRSAVSSRVQTVAASRISPGFYSRLTD